MNVQFSNDGWREYLHWARIDPNLFHRVNELIEGIRRDPFSGLGKPEALRGNFSGWWSRRINSEHRLIYRVQGRRNEGQKVEIIKCRNHY